jgi:RNA polymerase sigma-70 factor (ECF subfamily)
LRAWIEPYLGRLYGFAFALTQDRDESYDLVQDCALRALSAARRPSDEPARRAWLFRILRNTFIDKYRRNGVEVGFDPAIDDYADDADAGWCGDRRLIDVVTVRIAVARLPTAQREVIALVDFVGLSYREAAEVLGVAEGTIMSRLARARKALLDVLEQENVTPLARARGQRR